MFKLKIKHLSKNNIEEEHPFTKSNTGLLTNLISCNMKIREIPPSEHFKTLIKNLQKQRQQWYSNTCYSCVFVYTLLVCICVHVISVHLRTGDVQHILFCIFILFCIVLCTQCCQFLWIVHLWLSLRYSLTFIYLHDGSISWLGINTSMCHACFHRGFRFRTHTYIRCDESTPCKPPTVIDLR